MRGMSGLEGDGVPQALQALDEPAVNTLGTALVEVVDAQVSIDLIFTAEHVIDDDEKRMTECDGSFLLTAASGQPTIRVRAAPCPSALLRYRRRSRTGARVC